MKADNLKLLDEIEQANKISKRFFGVSFFKTVTALTFVVFLGLYVSHLAYGPNSWSVVQKLQTQVDDLKTNIENLKKENAMLHKRYFDFQVVENESSRLLKGNNQQEIK